MKRSVRGRERETRHLALFLVSCCARIFVRQNWRELYIYTLVVFFIGIGRGLGGDWDEGGKNGSAYPKFDFKKSVKFLSLEPCSLDTYTDEHKAVLTITAAFILS